MKIEIKISMNTGNIHVLGRILTEYTNVGRECIAS